MNFAFLAFSTLIAFCSLVGFESALAGVDTRAMALTLEIAAQNKALLSGESAGRSAISIESGIRRLHLADSPRQQIMMLFADLEAIGGRRNVKITSFRHEVNTRYDVTVEGEYPATLAALADLSASHVAAQTSRVLFDRADGHVRAAFSLDVFRLGDASAHNHVP